MQDLSDERNTGLDKGSSVTDAKKAANRAEESIVRVRVCMLRNMLRNL